MGQRPAEQRDSARVAVVGASTALGMRLRDALVGFGVPGERVDLYGSRCREAVVSEYDGEARLIQPAELAEIARHEVIFLCEDGEIAKGIPRAAAPGSVVIDLLDCLPSSVLAQPLRSELDGQPSGGLGRCFAVPHPLTLLLADLLRPLENELGIEELSAVVIRPAADFGEAGIEELREQTVNLLRFEPFPVEIFGRQLAFNVIPQSELGRSEPGVEARIGRELAQVLGWAEPRAGVKLITAPLFYGHAAQLRLRLSRQPAQERVARVLEQAGLLDGAGGAMPRTPLDVTGEVRTAVSDLAADGLGGFWLWAVAGEAASRGAEHAVRLAARLAGL